MTTIQRICSARSASRMLECSGQHRRRSGARDHERVPMVFWADRSRRRGKDATKRSADRGRFSFITLS